MNAWKGNIKHCLPGVRVKPGFTLTPISKLFTRNEVK